MAREPILTRKQRKETRQSLKSLADKAERWIMLAEIGNYKKIQANSAENADQTASTRATIIAELTQIKTSFRSDVEFYISAIEEAIELMS